MTISYMQDGNKIVWYYVQTDFDIVILWKILGSAVRRPFKAPTQGFLPRFLPFRLVQSVWICATDLCF